MKSAAVKEGHCASAGGTEEGTPYPLDVTVAALMTRYAHFSPFTAARNIWLCAPLKAQSGQSAGVAVLLIPAMLGLAILAIPPLAILAVI